MGWDLIWTCREGLFQLVWIHFVGNSEYQIALKYNVLLLSLGFFKTNRNLRQPRSEVLWKFSKAVLCVLRIEATVK